MPEASARLLRRQHHPAPARRGPAATPARGAPCPGCGSGSARHCPPGETASVRVLILTTFDLDAYVYAGLRAGAGGFLLKDTPPDGLLTAIRVVAAGEALLAPTVTRRLIAEFTRRPATPPLAPDLDGVTEREREVLTLIARGLSNAEICAYLHLSPWQAFSLNRAAGAEPLPG
ncbi:response regulator transcription factor [Nonomuraea diastatica]|uniref:Response regulator transcription factor n=1 Tax=Nonomuraea diastatica TaxID=1848329 RepID=A0A4V2YFY4_9ACTN|nr:response regulator transcription factor [Nonomuraea diastatica]